MMKDIIMSYNKTYRKYEKVKKDYDKNLKRMMLLAKKSYSSDIDISYFNAVYIAPELKVPDYCKDIRYSYTVISSVFLFRNSLLLKKDFEEFKLYNDFDDLLKPIKFSRKIESALYLECKWIDEKTNIGYFPIELRNFFIEYNLFKKYFIKIMEVSFDPYINNGAILSSCNSSS